MFVERDLTLASQFQQPLRSLRPFFANFAVKDLTPYGEIKPF